MQLGHFCYEYRKKNLLIDVPNTSYQRLPLRLYAQLQLQTGNLFIPLIHGPPRYLDYLGFLICKYQGG